MFKLILKPLQILKLSFVINAHRKMLGLNVLIFVSMGVLTAAAAHKSERNLCASEIFSIFFLKQGLLVPSTVAFCLSRVNLALNLLSKLPAIQ